MALNATPTCLSISSWASSSSTLAFSSAFSVRSCSSLVGSAILQGTGDFFWRGGTPAGVAEGYGRWQVAAAAARARQRRAALSGGSSGTTSLCKTSAAAASSRPATHPAGRPAWRAPIVRASGDLPGLATGLASSFGGLPRGAIAGLTRAALWEPLHVFRSLWHLVAA